MRRRSWTAVQVRVREFYAALLVAETAMIGLFAATNLFLFYVFWELMVVPMFLLIGVWGGPGRVYAAVKFLHVHAGRKRADARRPDRAASHERHAGLPGAREDETSSLTQQAWLFVAFPAAFAVKVPMFPVHTWLPDAHTEAPTAGSVILAGILLKMGGYGLLRIALPILPDAVQLFLTPMLVLSAVAIVYGAYVTLAQTDVKRLIAYSSISHMGFVTLGIFTLDRSGVEGAILQMINHGIITGALFLCVGMIYERTHTREIADYGGLFKARAGLLDVPGALLPGGCRIPGPEFLRRRVPHHQRSLQSLALARRHGRLGRRAGRRPTCSGFTTAWSSASSSRDVRGLRLDLNAREVATLAPLAMLAVVIGLYPESVLGFLRASVTQLLAAVAVERRNCGATVRDLLLLLPELVLAGVALALILVARHVQRARFAAGLVDRGGRCRRLLWLGLLIGRPERPGLAAQSPATATPVFQGPLRCEPGAGRAALREAPRCRARAARRVLSPCSCWPRQA